MKAPRRSPGFNALVVGGIVALFVIAGVLIWQGWTADAVSAADGGGPNTAPLWALVVIGGPIFLIIALVVAKLRSRKATTAKDPATSPDDPALGM